ncbi:MAG: hypothetical protein PF508_17645 [Spirochaeta sp.]|nr:hypothetical protein [Spirochaeta sp.]
MVTSYSGLSWRLLLGIDLIIGTVTAGYAGVHLSSGEWVIGLAELGSVLLLGWASFAAIRARRGNPDLLNWVRRITAGVIVVLALFLVVVGRGVLEISPYLLALPPALYLLLSVRSALFVSFGFLASLLVLLFLDLSLLVSTQYELSWVVAYAVINAFLYMITELQRRAYQEVHDLATHDPTTGLPRLTNTWRTEERSQCPWWRSYRSPMPTTSVCGMETVLSAVLLPASLRRCWGVPVRPANCLSITTRAC